MTPEERYRADPQFKLLVDTIYNAIVECRYTPTEVREAAMLAAIKYSMYHIERMPFPMATPPDGGREEQDG